MDCVDVSGLGAGVGVVYADVGIGFDSLGLWESATWGDWVTRESLVPADSSS